MRLDDLMNKTESELKALTKADIIKAIVDGAWSYNRSKEELKELQAFKLKAKEPINQIKNTLIGFTGYDVELNEYTKKPELDSVDVNFLIGMTMRMIGSN